MRSGSRHKKGIGITRRIALMSWSVTLLTLLIFAGLVIPQQKRIFQENLESKARGIEVSLHGIAANSVAHEDYSSVIDQCVQLQKGDPTVSFVVLVRNDGFSIVTESSGGRLDNLNSEWCSGPRRPQAHIGPEPLFGSTCFHYSSPFNCFGKEWGWIHIGLSIKAYERDVSEVYLRTTLLALVCGAISLLISVTHARRLVRPIRSLQSVVRQVALGDLSARASIFTGDEVEDLATSFNDMTYTLQRRDQILEGVRFTAREMLGTEDWRESLFPVLAKLGQASECSRAYTFEVEQNKDGQVYCCHHCEWTVSGLAPHKPCPGSEKVAWPGSHPCEWIDKLQRGSVFPAHATSLAPETKQFLGPSLQSVILLPIMVANSLYGVLGFNQCDHEREWSEAEMDSFHAAADMLGAAIEQSRTRAALLEANQNLEQRVLERTSELRAEIKAREEALARLAEAQQLLMDASRKAGMAEVATGVLHNVGNVLNSVNVSVNLISDHLRNSHLGGIGKLSLLFEEHKNDLPGFFASDPRAKKVPGYLQSLARQLQHESSLFHEELASLIKNIEHIKQIVVMQQDYAQAGGVIDTFPINHIIEDAIRITEAGFSHRNIVLKRQFTSAPSVTLDKHKVLQILVNLLRNAQQASDNVVGRIKTIEISVTEIDGKKARIQVRDNGVGISQENLPRVFSHGFTTKRDGHGYGLHMSALSAQEMDGSLQAQSEGPDKGALFTLDLPMTHPS
jgi:two-component system, NtrC family, sensor kinase